MLIGFTVALAAVVMTWGLDFIKGTTKDVGQKTDEALKCATQLDFAIASFDCATGLVTIENNGAINISTVTFRINKGGDVVPTQMPGIDSLGIKQYTLDLTGASKLEAVASVAGASGSTLLCKDAVQETTLGCP